MGVGSLCGVRVCVNGGMVLVGGGWWPLWGVGYMKWTYGECRWGLVAFVGCRYM